MNTIGQIFQEKERKEAHLKELKYDISHYMSKRGISSELQSKVRKFLDYQDSRDNDSPEKGVKILNSISNKLKEDVYKEFYGKILNGIKLFKFNFGQEFIEALALSMDEVVYAPGEVIFSEGEQDYRLFYIVKGEIECFLKKPGSLKNEIIIYDVKTVRIWGAYFS